MSANPLLLEHYYSCPYCGEAIFCIIDLTVPAQHYVEDCTVCCQPIELSYAAADGIIESFHAGRQDG